MLKKTSEKILTKKGLKISCSSSSSDDSFVYTIVKPIEITGNNLENYGITNLSEYDSNKNRIITKTDLPILALLRESGKWRIDCSEFVPIPGPGDFSKEFNDEESAIKFILIYFFESNEHIAALRKHLANN